MIRDTFHISMGVGLLVCFGLSLLIFPSASYSAEVALRVTPLESGDSVNIQSSVRPEDNSLSANQNAFNQLPTGQVRPSITDETYGSAQEAYGELAGSRTFFWALECIRLPSGIRIPYCEVTGNDSAAITPNGDPAGPSAGDPAGHLHSNSSRPLGSFEPDIFDDDQEITTGANGRLIVEYTAPEVAGLIAVRWTGTPPGGSPDDTIFLNEVRVPNMETIPFDQPGEAQALIVADEASTTHDRNQNYVRGSFKEVLQTLHDNFADALVEEDVTPSNRIPPLTFTSLQLPWGGLFDVAGGDGSLDTQWSPMENDDIAGHFTHRLGFSADLEPFGGALNSQERDVLADVIRRSQLWLPVRCESDAFDPVRCDGFQATHWHFTAPPINPDPDFEP